MFGIYAKESLGSNKFVVSININWVWDSGTQNFFIFPIIFIQYITHLNYYAQFRDSLNKINGNTFFFLEIATQGGRPDGDFVRK